MKSVRKFFGHLCGRSGRRAEEHKGESPLVPPRENEEKQIEPTLLADDLPVDNEKKQTLNEYLTQSSYESLTESPSSRKKHIALTSVHSVHCIYDVTEWKPENLGAPPTDKVFSDAVEILEPFFGQAQSLAALLLKFSRQYSRDKKPNFIKCYQVYLKNKAVDGSDDYSFDGKDIMDISDADLKDPNDKQVKEIVVNGKKLLELIDTIKPQVAEKIDEASKFDVKEAGKEAKDDTGSNQGGLLSKFSAPGKFRRNLKQLKENHKLLDSVHSEVESILLTIKTERQKVKCVTASNQDLQRSGSPTLLDMAANMENVGPDDFDVINDSHEAPPCITKEQTGTEEKDVKHGDHLKADAETEICSGEGVPEITDEKEPGKTEVKSLAAGEETQKNELSSNQPNLADMIHEEHADIVLPLRSDSPAMREAQTKDESAEDQTDSSRLLDFGSYIFVDPSASDEVMMRGSRSLDSLCSVSSRRTLSKYGSYEFVTDFELKIAEKAEDQRQKMTESTMSKKTKTKRAKKSKSTKTSGSRDASSPLYKYTEVDYNPMGF